MHGLAPVLLLAHRVPIKPDGDKYRNNMVDWGCRAQSTCARVSSNLDCACQLKAYSQCIHGAPSQVDSLQLSGVPLCQSPGAQDVGVQPVRQKHHLADLLCWPTMQ